MLRAAELRVAAERQAHAHGVEMTPQVRGVLANVLQIVLGEWSWEYEELERLRELRVALQVSVDAETERATVYRQLADLEQFYAARERAKNAR